MTGKGLDSSLLHPDRAGQGWAGQGSQQLLSQLPQPGSTHPTPRCPFALSSDEWRGPEEWPEGFKAGLRSQSSWFSALEEGLAPSWQGAQSGVGG